MPTVTKQINCVNREESISSSFIHDKSDLDNPLDLRNDTLYVFFFLFFWQVFSGLLSNRIVL